MCKLVTNVLVGAFLYIVILAFISVLVDEDYKEVELREAQHYCAMVAMWEADKADGKDVYNRNGHPPYDRNIDCRYVPQGEQQ